MNTLENFVDSDIIQENQPQQPQFQYNQTVASTEEHHTPYQNPYSPFWANVILCMTNIGCGCCFESDNE